VLSVLTSTQETVPVVNYWGVLIFILYNCIKHLDLNQLNAATGRKYDTALAAVVVCVLIIH
jgi:hypothetical protein